MSVSSFIDISAQRALYYVQQIIPFLKRVSADFARTRKLWRWRRTGTHRYTVVSAVYNVSPYLDDFFRSLTGQILDFKRHIQVIMVDDGSTDDSAAVIKHWQKRYPDNITYIHKENGGQGSARNVGIPLVRTPWVTFIDPDDFVDVTYFARVDTFLDRYHRENQPESHIHLLGCNYILYYERSGRFRDEHPLRTRFTEKEKVFTFLDMDNFLQLSVNAAFFRTAEIERQSIRFGERRCPSFEDTHFIARYLQGLASGQVALARAPRYYYRKRTAGDSSLNVSRQDKRYYLEQTPEAVLELLECASAAANGAAPVYIQRAALYHLWWIIKTGMNFPAPACLDENEASQWVSSSRQCFAAITPEVILSLHFFCPLVSWIHIVGMLHYLKKATPPIRKVFISRYDATRGQACLIYHSDRVLNERVLQNGKSCPAYDAKITTHTLWGNFFCLQRQFWVDLTSGENLEVRLDGKSTLLVLGETEFPHLTKEQIENCFAPPPTPFFARRYVQAWVFADRGSRADDNAEHFYRYIKHHHPEREIYFALSPSSHDWSRLKREGFVLLRLGGWKYNQVVRGCSLVISSHLSKRLVEQAAHKRYIFLKHGVIQNDLSNWLNPKKLDLVITSTRPEYDSIVKDGSPYVLSTRETRLTGLPRHDTLTPSIGRHDNMLLVMPTWRQYLKKALEQGSFENFVESPYARYWKYFLVSEGLHRIAEEQGMRIVFFPHAKMQKSLPYFGLPNHIKVVSHAGSSIQTLFRQAAILVTDYSSVAFEMAFLKKPVLYYQFDRENFFSGAHTTLKGYYDYARDGFGPVAEDEETLLRHLESIMRRGGTPNPEYLRRMEKMFPFRDGHCCERVYKAIEELESSSPFARRSNS